MAVVRGLPCFLLFILVFKAQGYYIPYSDPSRCSTSQYFQFSSLRCVNCGAGQTRSVDRLTCVCSPGYKITESNGGPNLRCEACSTGSGNENRTTSLDGWSCVLCPVTVGFDATNGKCIDCPLGSVATDRTVDGTRISKRVCLQCAQDTTPASGSGVCKRCHSSFPIANPTAESCICPVTNVITGGICLNKSDVIRETTDLHLFTVTYDSGKKIPSYFFKDNLPAARALCKEYMYKNFTACQLLGNLCVLLDYNLELYEESSSLSDACKEFLNILKERKEKVKGKNGREIADWAIDMPWLYYIDSARPDPIEALDKRDISTTFKANTPIMFTVSMFTLNGSFLGLENGTSRLQLCQERLSKMASANKFATTYKSSCVLPVSILLKMPTYFYDMFMKVDNSMYAIPVLVLNYKKKTVAVNEGSDRTKWQLTRRFFMVENIVGRRSSNGNVQMVRYAESVNLHIRLRSSNGQIYPPMLKIKYNSVDVSDEAVVAKSSKSVSFSVTYSMDMTIIDRDTHTAVGCLSGLAAVLALIKVFSWRRRHGSEAIDCSTLLKLIMFSFGTFSTMYFWIIFGLSLQWLIFFKQQDTVYRLLPTGSQERLFMDLLIVSFVFKLFDLLHMVWAQISIDIFFIDWERPRGRITQPNQGGDSTGADAPISIWRTFFVANEWNEIQTMRKISPEFQILATLFFLKVVGFEHLTTTDPISRFKVDYTTEYIGEYSHILRFAVLTLVYLTIECLQWFYFAFIYERFVSDSLGDFVDLCSMGNVSIFIMVNTLYGYYTHGRSVHGRADTNMKEMNEQLKREEEDLCGKRGLEPNSDHQTFEVGLPQKFRQQYDKFLEPLRQRDQAQRRNLPSSAAGGQGHLSVAVERSIAAYMAMNRFLCGFIDHSLHDMDYLVQDKLLLERIIDMEIREQPVDKAILYKDDGRSFNSVLFYGNEWTLLLFDLLFFAMVDYVAVDYVLAGVLTYIMGKILVSLRDSLGRRNLARKTMVDERFLI